MLTKKDLVPSILNSYKLYCDYGYPKDPKVYIIRGNKNTVSKLRHLQEQTPHLNKSGKTFNFDCFMSFRLEENNQLSDNEVEFGPELVTIRWR